MVKLVYCITKKDGLSDEEFFQYQDSVHSPMACRKETPLAASGSRRGRPRCCGREGPACADFAAIAESGGTRKHKR
jgi:hypothetical protein